MSNPVFQHTRRSKFLLAGLDGSGPHDISAVVRSVRGLPGKADRPDTRGLGDTAARREVRGQIDAGPIAIGGYYRQASTKHHGRRARLWIQQYRTVDLSSLTVQRTASAPNTPVLGDDFARRQMAGDVDGQLSAQGYFSLDAGASETAFRDALYAEGDALPILTVAPAGLAVGRLVDMLLGGATENDVSTDRGNENGVQLSGTFMPDGGVQLGVALSDDVAKTAAAPTSWTHIDEAAATTAGGVAHVHVTAFTGTSVVLAIQGSADESTWSDLVTQAVAGVGAWRLAVSGSVPRYIRATIASGTYSSLTACIGWSRTDRADAVPGSIGHFIRMMGKDDPFAFQYGPAGSAAGKPRYSGNVRCSRVEYTLDTGSVVQFTGELVVDGEAARDTF